jgi:uncharacterized protein (DUF885 family)
MQPVGNELNRSSTIERWKKIPRYIQNEIDNLKEGIKINYTAPKQNVILVIKQLEELVKQSTTQSFFFTPAFKDSTPGFTNALKEIIEQQIYPQIIAYKEFLNNEYLNKAREELSIRTMPNGLDCYRALLRSNTTLTITPEEVYNNGVTAVEKREAKVKEIGYELYGTNDLKKIKLIMRRDTVNRFLSSEELLAFSSDAVDRAKKKIISYFNLIPTTTVEVKPLPTYAGQSAYSYNISGSENGGRPGTYFVQLFQFDKQDKGEVEKTAFHETYPGHHLQTAISSELVKSHPMVKYIAFNGFMEGWARYTEVLSDEMGLYTSDRNRLSVYASLPTGMVVDPGIHFKGWTREEAIQYCLEKLANSTREGAESYVDRIAIMPAQMTTYGVGEMVFWRLRNKAESVFGKKFDIKTFHDKCLELGTVPLNILEKHITEWLMKNGG